LVNPPKILSFSVDQIYTKEIRDPEMLVRVLFVFKGGGL
jgi:hypothetical protein